MPNTAHIVETALLILAAYLVGCVIGYLARRATQPRRTAQPAAATAAAEAAPAGAPLVTAPTIEPLSTGRRRTAAERLAAAAGRSPVDEAVSAATGPLLAQMAPMQPPADPVIVLAPLPVPPAEPPPGAAPVPANEPADEPAPGATAPAPAAVAAIQPAAESVVVLPPSPAPPTETPPAPALAPANEPPPDAAAPPVEPEPAAAPVVAADVPPIDEVAHVLEPAATSVEAADDSVAVAPEPEFPIEPEAAAAAVPSEPPIPATRTALEDPEVAAMRAIEGNWTPPPASRSTPRPVPHPEQGAAAATDVDDAMETARSAVAAAAAAAAAAIAEAQERPRRPAADGLSFEQRSEQMAKSFLADASTSPDGSDRPTPALESGAADEDALPANPASGLSFEPPHPPAHDGFGRPEALPEPLHGGPDNLKQIKGITPALEASLHGLGIFHFDQIAGWDQKAVVWVDNHLSLRGRIGREKWLEQARDLSEGKGRTPRPVRR